MSNGGNHRRLEQSVMRGGVARMRERERMSASVSERERRENVVSVFVSVSVAVSIGRNHRRLEQGCDATRRNSTPYLLYICIYIIYMYIHTYI